MTMVYESDDQEPQNTNPADVIDTKALTEKCGVCGIFNHEDSAALATLALHALQHRGQEASGIVTVDEGNFHAHRGIGRVGDIFSDPKILERLPGHSAIGHNRYATSGRTVLRNVQPIYADLALGGFAIAHNGNLTNAMTLRQELVSRGSIFQSTSDTEVIVHLMAQAMGRDTTSRLIAALQQVQGAYALIGISSDRMIGVRDPYGVRPLVLGKLENAYVLASESCALDIMGAEFIRDVAPGEMVIIREEGIQSLHPFEVPKNSRFCVFEYIYFSRPDSVSEGRSVYAMRKAIGASLADYSPCPGADLVVPVPDSGVPAAIGYANQAGLPFDYGIIRNHYVGRTFIAPSQGIRDFGVKLKHNANRPVLEGKSVVLVDDSIVRGTTSRKIVRMVREAGAREVHMRIAAPPTTHSCYYGIDTPNQSDLIAHCQSVEDIAAYIGADSLDYLPISQVYEAIGVGPRNPDKPAFCDACFTGDYPIPLVDQEESAESGAKQHISALSCS